MISAVMLTTKSRWWCQYIAVEQWLLQEGREHDDELVIVSEDPLVVDAMPQHRQVRFVACDAVGLVEKWNLGIAATANDWVTFWADDDWHGLDRLRLLRAAPRVDIVGNNTILYHELGGDQRSFLYRYGGVAPYVVDGTMMIRKALWEKHPIEPKVTKGAASWWMVNQQLLGATVHVLPQSSYVAFIHGDNISAQAPRVSRHGEVLSDSYMTLVPKGTIEKIVPDAFLTQIVAAYWAQSGEQE